MLAVGTSFDIRQAPKVVASRGDLDFVMFRGLLAEVAGDQRCAALDGAVEGLRVSDGLRFNLAPNPQRVGDLTAGPVIEPQIGKVRARLAEGVPIQSDAQQRERCGGNGYLFEVTPCRQRFRSTGGLCASERREANRQQSGKN